MNWLNYHHLLYFWTVARTGSVTLACDELGLAQPTISSQVRALERAVGERLFRKKGRGLELTEIGRLTFDYANEIFSLGQELQGALRQSPTDRPVRLQVGVSDAVPKLVACEILRPALEMERSVQLIVREGKLKELLVELATHHLDLVISDEAPGTHRSIRAFSHPLGQSPVTVFAAPGLASELRAGFPASLDGARALLPTHNTSLRRSLDRWFHGIDVRPQVVAEFEDSALLKVFACQGLGFTAAPTVIRSEIEARYGLEAIGTADGCSEQFFAISVERKLKNPAVLAITSNARAELFSATAGVSGEMREPPTASGRRARTRRP